MNTVKFKIKPLIIVNALLISLIMGCGRPHTYVNVLDIDNISSSDSDIGMARINILPMYNVSEIRALTVVGWNINNHSEENEIELWISEDSTFSNYNDIKENCTLMYESPLIHGYDSTLVQWSDGLVHMRNLSILEDYFLNNIEFYIYVIGDSTPFDISIRVSFVIIATESFIIM